MEQKEKELLLKDFCTRLPYHDLYVQYDNKCWLAIGYGHGKVELMPNIFSSIAGPCPLIEDIKPYLRPMSSITEKEKEEFENLLEGIVDGIERWDKPDLCEEYDWLNAHHFDYRGLIEKGLALEVPEGMYKENN